MKLVLVWFQHDREMHEDMDSKIGLQYLPLLYPYLAIWPAISGFIRCQPYSYKGAN